MLQISQTQRLYFIELFFGSKFIFLNNMELLNVKRSLLILKHSLPFCSTENKVKLNSVERTTLKNIFVILRFVIHVRMFFFLSQNRN